jgi:hypothetical protein
MLRLARFSLGVVLLFLLLLGGLLLQLALEFEDLKQRESSVSRSRTVGKCNYFGQDRVLLDLRWVSTLAKSIGLVVKLSTVIRVSLSVTISVTTHRLDLKFLKLSWLDKLLIGSLVIRQL